MSSTEAKLRRKGVNDITPAQVDALLAEGYPGIFSLSREGRGPLAVPVWYEYRDGKVQFGCDPPGTKGKLLNRIGRATITVQREIEPYQYVMLEGEARFLIDDDLRARGETVVSIVTRIAARYLGPELADSYAAMVPILAPDYSVVELTPSTIIGESLRYHKDWLPNLADVPKIRQALEEGRSPREALAFVAAEGQG